MPVAPAREATIAPVPPPSQPCVAVVGLGYVGLPTLLALHGAGSETIGIDVSERRLQAIRARAVDLPAGDVARLGDALGGERLRLSSIPAAVAAADAVIVCVPTPVDAQRRPDPRALRAACASVVEHARPGQALVLTSTTFVGSTRELLVAPLAARGLAAGRDVAVAFAPERILPGDPSVDQHAVPRVLGGATPDCARRARELLAPTTALIHEVSSLEAAELTKLYENTFRAVNLAFANEMAGVCGHLGIDPVEIVDAAATKPYGFLAHYPGPGVGGHCIPVDPYYLLAPLRAAGVATPIADHAMDAIVARPAAVAARALALLRLGGVAPAQARVTIVGMAYKPGVADARESPGLHVAEQLERAGVAVAYHDPRVPSVRTAAGTELRSLEHPEAAPADLAIVTAVQPETQLGWLADVPAVLDATYRLALDGPLHRV
ncbi:MAG: nucleotide sugar dehydrogenase [Actinobacteria bacterium]|nr:nucleotide sugar dehydrogenase [Actinomycetota bacterium]